MTDFNELIKRSLSIVNESYAQAKGDVEGVIERIDFSLRDNAGDHFALVFAEFASSLKGVVFRVHLDTDVYNPQSELVTIVHMRILSTGYPIELGEINRNTGLFSAGGNALSSVQDVEEYFADQLSNPNSALIQAIGFALRKKMSK
ncbi:protein of unknown function [Pararobbsia alpina]|uniref:hypothetical protein n=1 Tax=Pararobbsia alpina TaxID=621374 RepID=UPI0039A4A0D5